MNYKKLLIGIIISIITIAISARLTYELPTGSGPIPITMQSLAVLCISVIAPRWVAIISLTLYVLLGALGLPIYADGASGIDVLTGGSGGYLIGFIIAGAIISSLSANVKRQTFPLLLIHMTLGTIIIIACGVLYLAYLYGFSKSLEYGFFPVWRGAIVKIILGAVICYVVKRKFVLPLKG